MRILIADDHALFREGLRKLLEMEDDLSIVGEAANGDEAIRLTRSLAPDILLIDVLMPHQDGLDVLRALAASPTNTRVLLLTPRIDRAGVIKAFQLGARGVVSKSSATAILLSAIRTVASGQYWVGQETVTHFVRTLVPFQPIGIGQSAARDFRLTARELDVIDGILAACPNREIARTLSISEKTVKNHLTNIYEKLGVSNRLELARFAVHHGLEPTRKSSRTGTIVRQG